MSLSEERDTGSQDVQAVDEFRLVTELMVVASMAPGELEQAAIDSALGVSGGPDPLPEQRASP